jgi:MinD-like ATPase involved in chromosome partitioning or flagellar assembly
MPKRAFVPPHPDAQPAEPAREPVPATSEDHRDVGAAAGPTTGATGAGNGADPGVTPPAGIAVDGSGSAPAPPPVAPPVPAASPAAPATPPTGIVRAARPDEETRALPVLPATVAPTPQPGVNAQPGGPIHQGGPVRPSGPGPQPGGPPFAGPGAGDPRSASELTDFTIVKPRSDVPVSGWRRALYAVSRGTINPGIGPVERHRQDLVARIQRPLPGSHFVAVLSLKGGVGKSTVAAMLGLLLSEHRGDRVVGVDANPDAGTLADRLTGDSERSVRDLLENLDGIRALPDVARFTSLIGRLQVVASAQDPTMRTEFDRRGYEQVTGVLSRYYDIIITDSGTGLLHSAMGATLQRASSVVVVGAPTVDGASRASKTLDWLVAHGFGEAVERAVVVLSADRTSGEVDVGRLRAHFGNRCRAVVEIPRDPHLAAGGRIEVARLRPATADAYLELSALVADEFGSAPPQRTVS